MPHKNFKYHKILLQNLNKKQDQVINNLLFTHFQPSEYTVIDQEYKDKMLILFEDETLADSFHTQLSALINNVKRSDTAVKVSSADRKASLANLNMTYVDKTVLVSNLPRHISPEQLKKYFIDNSYVSNTLWKNPAKADSDFKVGGVLSLGWLLAKPASNPGLLINFQNLAQNPLFPSVEGKFFYKNYKNVENLLNLQNVYCNNELLEISKHEPAKIFVNAMSDSMFKLEEIYP